MWGQTKMEKSSSATENVLTCSPAHACSHFCQICILKIYTGTGKLKIALPTLHLGPASAPGILVTTDSMTLLHEWHWMSGLETCLSVNLKN